MEYRVLGRTGVKVSTHSLGAMALGRQGNPDHDDCIRMVHTALDAGINLIDTADVYSQGESEVIVGKALRGRRDQVVLATKVHFPAGKGVNEAGNSRLWIMRALEASLRRLATDHIDLYQLHRPDEIVDIEETLGVLGDLVSAGKIRYAGTSTFPAWQLVDARRIAERDRTTRFACEQPPYSIFVRTAERDLFEVTRRLGMGVLAWSPLAGGWLTGKYRKDRAIPEDSRAVRAKDWGERIARRFDMARPANRRKLDLVEDLARIAQDAGMPMAHMAIAFTLAHPAVTSAIIGPRTMDHLVDLLGAADVRLDAGTLDAIDEVVEPGSFIEDADRGWSEPWMKPEARRRPTLFS
ncbi:MAG: aldo/keto reductase [Actinomycetota bacterium]